MKLSVRNALCQILSGMIIKPRHVLSGRDCVFLQPSAVKIGGMEAGETLLERPDIKAAALVRR